MTCPLEKMIDQTLSASSLWYVRDGEGETKALDFYLPGLDIYIEVKRFHSERISEQMSRADNVIAIQGEAAARFFCQLLNREVGE